jgi:DNA-binding response OmpR family regulator
MAEAILLIEDQKELRNEVRALLEREGYVVHDASCTADGLAILATSAPCMLLLDTLTPGQDFSLIHEAILLGLPVVTLPVSAKARREAGVASSMKKTLASPELLLRIVREHCPRAEAIA